MDGEAKRKLCIKNAVTVSVNNRMSVDAAGDEKSPISDPVTQWVTCLLVLRYRFLGAMTNEKDIHLFVSDDEENPIDPPPFAVEELS